MPIEYSTAQKHFLTYDTDDTDEIFDSEGQIWCGPIDNCDICSRPMGSEIYMIDGPAEMSRDPRWGNLCVVCAFKHSPNIGWGKAQLYKRSGFKWYLIAGGPPPEIDSDV